MTPAEWRELQVDRDLRKLGVQMIPAYSPQARGRSESNFSTWQGRLPQEPQLRGIHSLEAANRFLREHYIAEFNHRFQVPAPGTWQCVCTPQQPRGGKVEEQTFPPRLEIQQSARDSHFPTASATTGY